MLRLLGKIQEWRWELEAGGFFVVSRKLIPSVMEKCVTYLIVLLQFNLALRDALLAPVSTIK